MSSREGDAAQYANWDRMHGATERYSTLKTFPRLSCCAGKLCFLLEKHPSVSSAL